MTLREWLPTAGEVAADLAHVPELPAEYDAWTAPWRGYELHFYSLERVRFFNGFAWSRASAPVPGRSTLHAFSSMAA